MSAGVKITGTDVTINIKWKQLFKNFTKVACEGASVAFGNVEGGTNALKEAVDLLGAVSIEETIESKAWALLSLIASPPRIALNERCNLHGASIFGRNFKKKVDRTYKTLRSPSILGDQMQNPEDLNLPTKASANILLHDCCYGAQSKFQTYFLRVP